MAPGHPLRPLAPGHPPGVLSPPRVVKHAQKHLCLHLKCKEFTLFKANFIHIKELETGVREPPDCIGNEPTLHIHIGDSWIDIKNDKYIISVMNMVIMCHDHHLGMENGG